jgi:hypothetical protein
VVAPVERFDTPSKYAEACGLASRGQHDEARRAYADLVAAIAIGDTDTRLRALVQNDLAVMAAMEGRFDDARTGWRTALEIDKDCLLARLNRDLVEAEINRGRATADFGELQLAPAPSSPLEGEVGPEGRMRGEVSRGGPPPLHGRGEGQRR